MPQKASTGNINIRVCIYEYDYLGRGVEEIPIRDDAGNFRVINTARLADAVCVLHAFQKKTQRTSQRAIEPSKTRFREMMKDRQ